MQYKVQPNVTDATGTTAEAGVGMRRYFPSRSPSCLQMDKSEEGISDVINTGAQR